MKRNRKFYLILLLGIGLIATSIMMVSKIVVKDPNQEQAEDNDDFVILNEEEEPSLEISKMEEEINIDNYFRDKQIENSLEDGEEEISEEGQEGREDEEFQEQPDSDLDYTLVETGSSLELETMTKPIDGEIGLGFTNGNLIYSKTLEEWTSHNGVDILAPKGTEVRAALNGTVTEVYKDELWGTVVIIDHGDGLLTKYASLSHDVQVIEGSNINQGDLIGTIDQTAAIEMMEESHLHFEVIEEGINKNPLDYLPKFTSNK